MWYWNQVKWYSRWKMKDYKSSGVFFLSIHKKNNTRIKRFIQFNEYSIKMKDLFTVFVHIKGMKINNLSERIFNEDDCLTKAKQNKSYSIFVSFHSHSWLYIFSFLAWLLQVDFFLFWTYKIIADYDMYTYYHLPNGI